MILRLLNWQGLAGLGIGLALLAMLTVQKLEAVHWRKQSEKFEQLYRQQQAAFATTVANYRAAAIQARADDQANARRVSDDSRAINERTLNDFEARLAAARADARRLRVAAQPAADSGARGSAVVPNLPASARGPAEASEQDGLPQSDALIATEQSIQLDELIKWVRQQHSVDPNPPRP